VLVVALIAGLAFDVLLGRWTGLSSAVRTAFGTEIPAFPASIPHLARRLLKDVAGAMLFLVAAAIVLVVFLPERETRVAMSIVLWLFFFPRIAWTVLRFFLSPDRQDLRLVDTDQRTAEILFRSLVGVILVVGLIQTIRLVMQEVGATQSALAIGFWVNLLVFLWLAVIVLRCRKGLQQIVRGSRDIQPVDEKWIVAAYPAYALIAIFGTWIAGLASATFGNNTVMLEGRHFLSLGILLVAPMCDALIRATVRIYLPPMQGSGVTAQDAFDAAWQSYVRVARVVVFGTVIIALSKLWGMSMVGLAQAGVGEYLGERVVVAILILMASYILVELVSIWINRKLANIQSSASPEDIVDEDLGPTEGGVASRAGTVLPLIGWTLKAVIILIGTITALGQLGVNVAALLAGAGVAGIAIGFGAQKLVEDLVSGVFFLLDDAFRINEYISTGSIDGTVEKIALQSMHLRKSDGAIHCVPYSSVDTITNYSRDWATAKVAFTVPFNTDIDKVRRIFKKIGQDLFENPELTDTFLKPFKFKGVSQINDLGLVVRGKYMFKPETGKQFLIQREIYRRIYVDFAQAGIQFARRELQVNINTNGNETSNEAVEAKLGASIEAPVNQSPRP
jgi:moderate conductance mechanosensitive channel